MLVFKMLFDQAVIETSANQCMVSLRSINGDAISGAFFTTCDFDERGRRPGGKKM